MTLVTGTVQDLGYDGMEGTLWARPARFRSDGQVVYAPERKPFTITGGVVSAELAPGPAVLELQVGSHARGTFEVVIPEADITLADLLDTVFPWEPEQISLFVAEREAAEAAAADAETAAGQATTAAQQTGQDRTAVASDKDTVVSHVQALAEPNDAAVLGLISEGADTATKAALNATYVPTDTAVRSLVQTFAPQPPTLQRVVATPAEPGPRFIDKIGDLLYAVNGATGAILTSPDGDTWTQINATWPGTGAQGFIERLIPTADGEMIAMSSHELRKSSGWSANPATATWSAVKITPNGSGIFNGFGIDGDGQKFVLTEYSPTPASWSDSRYAYISLDAGDTWEVAYDTVALHGAEAAAESHLHAACYDPWADVFYVGEGHGRAGGVYWSTDDGATWQGPMNVESTSSVASNAPTVIMATDDGLVMGSDNAENGVFGVVRKANPADQRIVWNWRMHTGRDGLVTFAQRGWRDPDTGLVYITFRAEYTDTPLTIAAGTAGGAGKVYEWPTLPVTGGLDRFSSVAKIGDDTLFVYGQINNGQPHHFKGTLTKPGASSASLDDTGNLAGGKALSPSALAVGRAIARAAQSFAAGHGASVAEGANGAYASGYMASASSTGATATGTSSLAGNAGSAYGNLAKALASGSAFGYAAETVGINGSAFGIAAKAGLDGIAIGKSADTSNVSRSIAIGTNLQTTSNDQLKLGTVHIERGLAGATTSFPDGVTPNNPEPGCVREFVRRNAAGKMEICARFPTGEAVVIATEP